MTRGKKYFIFLAGIAAFLFSPCLIKYITGYPCPACGTRRAFIALFDGKLTESLLINPYAIIFSLFFIISLLIIIYDYLTGKSLFFHFQIRFRKIFLRKDILFLLAGLTLLNWVWNIYKGL